MFLLKHVLTKLPKSVSGRWVIIDYLAVGHSATKTATNEVAANNGVAAWAGHSVVGAGHAQGQLHFTRTPADSAWSTRSKTEWMVLHGRFGESQLLLVKRERWLFNCFETTLAIWSEILAKGPYQKNTPSVVRL